MAQKVGGGYVDIDPRVNAAELKKLAKKIQTFLDGTPVNISVDVRATELAKLRQKINTYLSSRPVYLTVDVRGTTLAALRTKIQEALTLRPIYLNIDVRARDIAAARAKIAAGLAGINVGVNGSGGGGGSSGGGGGGGGLPPRPRGNGNGGGGGRNNRRNRRSAAGRLFGFGSQAGGGLFGGIASAFQLNGPIGGVIIATLAAALAAAAVPLGAMLGGLVFAALGTIPLVGAILIGLKDPAVTQAFTDLKQKFMDTVVNPLTGEFGATLTNILKQFSDGLDRWAPLLQSILRAGMSFAQPIATGAENAIDIFLPGFNDLVNSDFMKRIMEQLGKGLEVIASAFDTVFKDILNDPMAQEGMVRGLQDFFEGVKWVIEKIFDLLRFLARVWESWHIPDENGTTTVDRFKDLLSNVNEIADIMRDKIFTKENLDVILTVLEALFGFALAVLKNPLVNGVLDFATNLEGWDSIPGPSEILTTLWQKYFAYVGEGWTKTVDSAKQVWDEFTNWLDQKWQTVQVKWDEFLAFLKRKWAEFTAWIHREWDEFWAPFVEAWGNIQTGWDSLISGSFMGGWSNWDTWINQQLADFMDPFAVAFDAIGAGWNSLIGGLTSAWNSFFDWLTSKNSITMAKVTKTPTVSTGGGNNTTTAGKRFGGAVRFAGGGMALGPGSGISDSIPALISNGEFVVNAQATQANLGLLNAINNGAGYQPNISVYIDGVRVAHRAVVEEALGNVMSFVRAGRSD